MKKEGSIRTARIADNIVTYLILIVISLIFLFPCVWLIAASFSKSGDIHSFSGFFPEEFSVQTFVDLFTDDVNGLYPYGRWFLNTLYVATMTCIIGTLLTILTGYVMSRFRFKGRDTIRKTTLLLGMFPGFMGMTAVYIIMGQLNLLNSLTALGVLYATMQFPFAIFLLTGFLRSIPRDYEEAAMIDGCGPFRILTSIIIPMCKPGIVTVCMISAMAAWNEYPVALVMVTDPTKATLPVGLANLYEIQRYATDWGALFAALVLALIPTVILFIVGQKQLVQGLSVGGVKG